MKVAAPRRLPIEPERTCLGCGARFPKSELLRFVVRAGVLAADRTGLLPGRGAYCCRRAGCLKKFAARKGRLTKALRSEVVDCRVALSLCADEFASAPGGVVNLAGMVF